MRIFIKSDSLLSKMHPDLTAAERLMGITVDKDELDKYLMEAKTSVPHLSSDEQYVWAVYNAHRHPGHIDPKDQIVKKPIIAPVKSTSHHLILEIIIIILLLLLLSGIKLHAEPIDTNIAADNFISSARLSTFPQLSSNGIVNNILRIGGVIPTFTGSSLNINCTAGCGGAATFSDNSAFTVSTTPINIIGAYFTSGADPACTTGNGCRLRADASSNLKVNCAVGCSGSSFADNTAFTAGTTPISISGGWFSNSPTACTTGNACSPSMTSDRKMFVQDFQGTSPWVVSASGNFGVTQQTSPWVDNITQVASVALGGTAVVNYGSTPAGVPVPAVNSFITNTPTVTANAGTNLNTSALALDTSVNGILLSQGSTTSGQKGPLSQCAVTTGAPSYTTAQTDPLSCSTVGNLRVDGSSVTQPVSGTITANAGTGQFNVTCTTANCPFSLSAEAGTAITNTPTAIGTLGTGNVISVNSDLTSEHGTAITNVPTAIGTKGAGNVISVNSDTTSIAGTATSTGTGAVGTGTQRIAVGTDVNTVAGTAPEANNATASGTTKLPVLMGIAQTDYANGTAYTQGRDVVPDVFDDGALHVAALPAMRPASYHASASFAGSSTTFNAHLAGNATNTVLVTKITWTCTQTTAGILTVTVNKTSAASTGGTAATITAVPDDSGYAAASSVAQSFTGTGPTVGTLVGQIDAAKVGCGATTSVNNDIYILNLRQKPIVLRNTTQTLEVGVGAAITGGNVTVTFEWMETKTITP